MILCTLSGTCREEVITVDVSEAVYYRFGDRQRAWGCTTGELLMLIKTVMTPGYRDLSELDIKNYIDRVERRIARRERDRELTRKRG